MDAQRKLLFLLIFIFGSDCLFGSFLKLPSFQLKLPHVQLHHFETKETPKLNLTTEEIKHQMNITRDVVVKMERLEQNLLITTELKEGTLSYDAMLNSWADDDALEIAKESYIKARVTAYFRNTKCRYQISDQDCMKQLKSIVVKVENKMNCSNQIYRTFNGSCNNPNYPRWGVANTAYSRILPPSYCDGVWLESGNMKKLENPSTISSMVYSVLSDQIGKHTLALGAWTRLILYDMAHTASYRTLFTKQNIICCSNRKFRLAPRYRHPFCLQIGVGNENCINYVRSMLATPDEYELGPAEQMNTASHFLDASVIYGTSEQIADALRTKINGMLKTGNDQSDINCVHGEKCYFTAELRSLNDPTNAVLLSILRSEHNRLASELIILNPNWNDEKLYQESRRILIAEIQHITYSEWLPIVIGEEAMKIEKSVGYSRNIKPTVANSFGNAAMKIFNPSLYVYTKILSSSSSKKMVESMANLLSDNQDIALFSQANETEIYDLTIDIQRGRDHGLPSFTKFRKLFGLPYKTWHDLSDTISFNVLNELKKYYRDVDELDLIVGGILEKPEKGCLVGPVFKSIITQQMIATKKADRFFYDQKDQPNPFTPEQVAEIKKTTLSRILCDNMAKNGKIQPSAFLEPTTAKNKLVSCTDGIKKLNLSYWIEKI